MGLLRARAHRARAFVYKLNKLNKLSKKKRSKSLCVSMGLKNGWCLKADKRCLKADKRCLKADT